MNYTLVGAFVLALGATLVAVVLWLASGGAFQKKYDLYHAIMDESVAGLNLNAPVKNNGVDVGKVRDIRLDRVNPERVVLLLAIERGTSIKEDTVAVLKTQGLTGIAYVELSGGTRAAPELGLLAGNAYPVIRTKPSLGARLENVLTSVLAKLDSTSNNINVILGEENRAALKSALADIAIVARTVAARKDALDASLVLAEKTLKNTATASTQIAPMLERIGQSAAAIEKMGSDFSQTSASATKAVDAVAASTTKAVDAVGADVSRFTANTLPELQQLLAELGALTTSLRRVTEQTERDPRGLLFGRKPVANGPGE